MAMTQKKLQRVGNSTGLVLPADILTAAGLQRGSEVVVHAEKGRVVLTLVEPEFDAMCALADAVIADHPNALRKLGQ
jgi:putative addiction module antidote